MRTTHTHIHTHMALDEAKEQNNRQEEAEEKKVERRRRREREAERKCEEEAAVTRRRADAQPQDIHGMKKIRKVPFVTLASSRKCTRALIKKHVFISRCWFSCRCPN